MFCMRSAVTAALSALVLLGFFAAVALSTGCTPALEKVRDNLNDQRVVYDLDPVSAEDCDALSFAFDGYAELVTNTVPMTDPNWETIAASECRTLQAHLRAYDEVCPNNWPTIPDEVSERCLALTGE